MDKDIATCLYTSIVFDTQLFRYIRDTARSHEIAADVIKYEVAVTKIHRFLFGNQTVNKMTFLAKALSQIEYLCEGGLAVIRLRDSDLFDHKLEPDDSRDVIDMVMNIESLEAAILLREVSAEEYKLSLRSKGSVEVLSVAEAMGGGGHVFAAGAYIRGTFEDIRNRVVTKMIQILQDSVDAKKTKN